MEMEPKFVIWKCCPAARVAFKDWSALIKEAAAEPMHVNKLVSGPVNYKGTLDASGEGAGDIWVLGEKDMAPIVWQVKWPQEIQDRLITFANPTGDITNGA